MKRSASGGSIMSAFANAPPKKPKPKEEKPQGNPSIPIYVVPVSKLSPEPAPRISAKRQQELDNLNKMMEDDEPEELEDFPPDEAVNALVDESQDTAATDSPAGDIAPDEPPKRKRGKRKVLRKITQRDDKGYLSTISG